MTIIATRLEGESLGRWHTDNTLKSMALNDTVHAVMDTVMKFQNITQHIHGDLHTCNVLYRHPQPEAALSSLEEQSKFVLIDLERSVKLNKLPAAIHDTLKFVDQIHLMKNFFGREVHQSLKMDIDFKSGEKIKTHQDIFHSFQSHFVNFYESTQNTVNEQIIKRLCGELFKVNIDMIVVQFADYKNRNLYFYLEQFNARNAKVEEIIKCECFERRDNGRKCHFLDLITRTKRNTDDV
jgi:hypothetical protein